MAVSVSSWSLSLMATELLTLAKGRFMDTILIIIAIYLFLEMSSKFNPRTMPNVCGEVMDSINFPGAWRGVHVVENYEWGWVAMEVTLASECH